MSLPRRAALLLALLAACRGVPLAACEAETASDPDPRGPTAGGRLLWDSSGELDLIGDLWVDAPFRIAPGRSLFVTLETRTAIERATDSLTFLVRDLQYEIDLGWRAPVGWTGGRPLSIQLGQRGKEGVDRDGQAYLRYVGLAVESAGYRLGDGQPFGGVRSTAARRIEWRLAGGPVVERREVDGDFVLRADARLRPGAGRSDWLSLVRGDISFDGFFDGSSLHGDLTVGPAVALPVDGARRLSLFAYYLDSDNPLGLGHSGVLVGFEYAEGADSFPVAGGAPEIAGSFGAGLGAEDRQSGELSLRFLSPPFLGRWYAVVEIDVNVLTAEDTGDLYYPYFGGMERATARHRVGVYFFHRSNHELAEPNDTVTSLNVAEVGGESEHWYRSGPRALRHAWGALDWRARVGYLIDSSFGEEVGWHARGGVRWTTPVGFGGGIRLFVAAWIEGGDVERRLYSAGLALPPSWDVGLRWIDDEQLFSRDPSALLLVGRYGF